MHRAPGEQETLDLGSCLDLLRHGNLGRLAISSGALPVIVPVNYHVVGDVIVVRTDQSRRLRVATDDTVVAFEAGGIDDASHAAWTVGVSGIARQASPAEQDAVDLISLPDWISPHADRLVAISIESLSGYRVQLQPGPATR